MTKNYHIRLNSATVEKSLIVSDEFKSKTDAETYRDLLFKLLTTPNPCSITDYELDGLTLELLVCEVEPCGLISPISLEEAIPKLWGDLERAHQFIEEAIDEILIDSLSEEIDQHVSE